MLFHFTDGQSSWQNGPTERAGGAFKEVLDKVVLDATVLTHEEYHEAVDLLVAQRNARAGRSGFSPDRTSLGKTKESQAIRWPMISSTLAFWERKLTTAFEEAGTFMTLRRERVLPEGTEACKAALAARRWNSLSEEDPEGSWVMVWTKHEGEGRWYGRCN